MGASTLIEVCVQDAAGCRAAEAGGADRLELCSALSEGGLTPTLSLLEAARAASRLPVIALVRPRRGDFAYDGEEHAQQLADVQRLVAAGVDGLAVGAVLPDGELDAERLAELVAAAAGLPLTCHRAFDHTRDGLASLDVLLELGFARVLTSGHAAAAPEGAQELRALVERAAGKIEVIAGGGVRPHNVAALVRGSGVPTVHLSAGRPLPSPMRYRNERVFMGAGSGPDDFVRQVTDGEVVRSCRRELS